MTKKATMWMRLSRSAARCALLCGLGVVLAQGASRAEECDDGSVEVNAAGLVEVHYRSEVNGVEVMLHDVVEPQNRVLATVQETHVQDPTTGVYTYTYQVTNSTSSPQAVYWFRFSIPPSIPIEGETMSQPPPCWLLEANEPRLGGFGWSFHSALPRPDKSVKGLRPGESLTVSFRSPMPPGPMKMFLRGYAPIPTFQAELPECIGDIFFEYETWPKADVMVLTTGPVEP